MRKQTENTETANSIRMDYLMEAQWYFVRAEGPDENLISAMHRMNASRILQRMQILNLDIPGADEIRQFASEKWPEHKLHNEAI